MSARAEQMAAELADRMFARLTTATKAYGLGPPPSRAELAATFLPICEGLMPVYDGVEELSAAVRKMRNPRSKIGKLQRRNERLMKAIAQQPGDGPIWGRGPR